MSEHDEDGAASGPTAPEPPEFVAVTPRGVVPEHSTSLEAEPPADNAADPAQPEPTSEPESTLEPAAASESAEAQDQGTESERPSPLESPSVPEPPTVPDSPTLPEPPVAAEPGPAAADTPAPAPEEAPAAEAEPVPPVSEPEPASEPAGPPEVAAGVAAEGMADALSGHAAPDPEHDADSDRLVGVLGIATTVCVVLALAAGVLLGITARSNSHRRAAEAARVAAVAAATRETRLVLTYNYRTLDQDIARAEGGMSPSFRANYANTMTTQVKPLALKNHSSSTATVVATGVVKASPSRVVILLFADQVVQNTLLSATSRLDQSTNEVTMLKQNGRWVINHIDTF